ncbi:MAG: nuclease-related domain-containing protein [Fimbriimonadaceae bacterium]
MSIQNRVNGWLAEQFLNLVFLLRLPSDTYKRLYDVTLPAADSTAQIDHVLVSRFGIFVVETKDDSGCIFGLEKDAFWTQTFGRTKFRIPNPLRQNYGHVCALRELLALPDEVFRSVVALMGNAKLKTEMPPNVRTSGIVGYIRSFDQPVLTEEQVAEAVRTIEAARLPRGWATNRKHVRNVRRKLSERKPGRPVKGRI